MTWLRCFQNGIRNKLKMNSPLEKQIEEINIQFHLTTLKPLHAKWLLEFYNQITSEAGADIIVNGWKASGIYDAVEMGSSALPSLDPFQDISPLPVSDDDDDTHGISDAVNVSSEIK